MTLAQRAVRGTAVVLASSYTNMGLGLVYGIIMARLLDSEHFGVFTGALFFATLFDLRGKLGLDYALIHRQPSTDELIATHWVLQVGSALLSTVIVGIAAWVIAQFNYPPATAPIMLALSGAMIIEATGSTARAILEKELIFARSTVVVTGALLLSYLGAIGLATRGYTYWALVGQVALNAFVSSLGFWWAYRRLGRRPSLRFNFDRNLALWMLRFSTTVAVGAMAAVILFTFDNFLVLTLVNAAALGYYAQAYKVAQWPTGLVTHIIARASLPTYAKLQHDPSRLGKAFEMSLWLILMTALPIALVLFVTARDFVQLLYGEKWLPSATLLQLLVGYSVLRPLLDDTGALFNAIGQPRRITTVLVIQAIVLVVVATPLTFWLNTFGTAIGVGIAFVIGVGLTYSYVAQALVINLSRLFTPPLLAAVGSLGLYFLLIYRFPLTAWPVFARVLVQGGLITGLFYAVLALIERRGLLDRIAHIWRLLRTQAEPPSSSPTESTNHSI